MQAQRAGPQAGDSLGLFPGVWEWKQPGYEDMCTDLLASLTPEQQAAAGLRRTPGYFEAGSAPLTLTCMHMHAHASKLSAFTFTCVPVHRAAAAVVYAGGCAAFAVAHCGACEPAPGRAALSRSAEVSARLLHALQRWFHDCILPHCV